ncbi:MAG TPA: GTPase domain-containing protein, partial [Kofleriaceae bacterium]
MAVLDPDANEIVIRVVYDGPPEAGKTTSLRALAASFAQTSVTPEEDSAGRTQWFDWMEYVGGRFEGSLIRCQIVSVPGQRELWERRRALLATADVVVFVADSTTERWDTSIDYLFELRELIAPEDNGSYESPVGVVLQANKRDVPNAVGLDDLRVRLGDARWSVGVVESVASDGAGIREAFVYAVRLALDRVRDLVAHGALPTGTPELTSPDQLLRQLREAEQKSNLIATPVVTATPSVDEVEVPIRVTSAEGTVVAELLREVFALDEGAPRRPAVVGAPALPDASAPSGAIWPPVEGRAILLEVSRLAIAPRRLANGDWSAGLGTGWRVVSRRDAVFDSLDGG